MTKFKFNISSSNELVESLEKNLQRYDELSDKIYANVKSSENVWIDPASMGFNTIVRQDESNLKDIKISLQRYLNNIRYFSQELGNIFNNRGYSLSHMSIYYDSSYVDICMDKLSSASSLLQNTLNEFSSCIVPEDFEYLSNINDVYNATSNILNNLNDLTTDLREIRRSISVIMNDSIKRNNDIELVNSNDRVTHFNWTIMPLVRRTNPTLVKENKYNVIQDNLHAKVNHSSLNSEIEPISISSNIIETNADNPHNMSSTNDIRVIDDRQGITANVLNNYKSSDNIDINSSVVDNSIVSNKLNTNDTYSINIDSEMTEDISLQLSENKQHRLENNVTTTNVESINLDKKTEPKVDMTTNDTTTDILLD